MLLSNGQLIIRFCSLHISINLRNNRQFNLFPIERMFSFIKYTGFTLVVIVTVVSLSYGAEIKLSNNYILNYNLINNNNSIEFKIQAINVTGWVGIGVNNVSANMNGSDIFMGGYHANNRTAYGADYYVPRGAGNTRPTKDSVDNWRIVNNTEVNGTSYLHISRLLNTGDRNHDIVIQNRSIYLIWSYNAANDDVLARHTARGSVSVNLVGTGGGGGTPPTTTTTTTTTTTKRTTNSTTTPKPGGSGANTFSFGFEVTIFCLIVSLFKS